MILEPTIQFPGQSSLSPSVEEEMGALPDKTSAISRIWNTAAAYTTSLVRQGGRADQVLPPEKQDPTHRKKFEATIQHLVDWQGNRLNSMHFRSYLLYLIHVTPFAFGLDIHFLQLPDPLLKTSKPSVILTRCLDRIKEEKGQNPEVFLLPYLRPGHCMTFYFDFKQKVVEFFCPLGTQVEDLEKEGWVDFDLKEDVGRWAAFQFGVDLKNLSFRQMPQGKALQKDTHNCGAWSLLFLQKRLQSASFDEALQKLSSIDIYSQGRDGLAANLMSPFETKERHLLLPSSLLDCENIKEVIEKKKKSPPTLIEIDDDEFT